MGYGFEKNISNNKYDHYIFAYFLNTNLKIKYISTKKSDGLDIRNGTYASLAFISGVGNQNPSSGCEIRAFWKSAKSHFFGSVLHIVHVPILLSLNKNTATY